MFTGIIQAPGSIQASEADSNGRRLLIASDAFDMADVAVGDSIAVDGVCLTATAVQATAFRADVSAETLRCTTLGQCAIGDIVNLERAMRADACLSGHFVSGHVDGVAMVTSVQCSGSSTILRVRIPESLQRYVAVKGSVCIDGVSLTVNEVEADEIAVNIIPHTREVTTLGQCQAGQAVNIEVDLIARYIERLLSCREMPAAQAGYRTVSESLLKQSGFIDV